MNEEHKPIGKIEFGMPVVRESTLEERVAVLKRADRGESQLEVSRLVARTHETDATRYREALTLIHDCITSRLNELVTPKRVDEMNADELAMNQVLSVATGALLFCQRQAEEALVEQKETLNTP